MRHFFPSLFFPSSFSSEFHILHDALITRASMKALLFRPSTYSSLASFLGSEGRDAGALTKGSLAPGAEAEGGAGRKPFPLEAEKVFAHTLINSVHIYVCIYIHTHTCVYD